jgi:asparagine synthase (glutamine-hydrolysing)
MGGIFGMFYRDGRAVDAIELRALQLAMPYRRCDGGGVWREGPCGLGRVRRSETADTEQERLPVWIPQRRIAFCGDARLDARDELCDRLAIPTAARSAIPDGMLLLRAYLSWGEAAVDRVIGDWSFAAWHADQRRLFLARDPQGTTALYYFADACRFHFASSLRALQAAAPVSRRADEVHLARILTSWPVTDDSSIFSDIRSVPFGRALVVTPDALRTHRYWTPEPTPSNPRKKDEDYVEGLREVLTVAVRDRLRNRDRVGVTLSGGLDSGTVTAIAARLLRDDARVLSAFTHVPQFHTAATGGRTGDERQLAAATARAAGVRDVAYLDSAGVSPISGIRRALAIHGTPSPAAANQFWLMDMFAAARARGIGTLLIGHRGNATISWTGRPAPAPWQVFWRERRWRRALVALLPARVQAEVRIARARRRMGREPWLAYSAIRPEFARRLHLAERMRSEEHDPTFSRPWPLPHTARIQLLLESGARLAETAAAHELSICDPTVDVRVIKYCLAVPDDQFVHPTGGPRWLIRRAMRGALPAEVLDNPRRGLQAADLVLRLRAHPEEMEAALDECERAARVADYIDLPRLRQVWNSVCADNSVATGDDARAILTRGLMAGLAVSAIARVES